MSGLKSACPAPRRAINVPPLSLIAALTASLGISTSKAPVFRTAPLLSMKTTSKITPAHLILQIQLLLALRYYLLFMRRDRLRTNSTILKL